MRGKRSLRSRCRRSCLGLKQLLIAGFVTLVLSHNAAGQSGSAEQEQRVLPEIVDASASDGVITFHYLSEGGTTKHVEIPAHLVGQLVREFARAIERSEVGAVLDPVEAPAGQSGAGLPTIKPIPGRFHFRQTDQFYSLEFYPDSLVTIAPEGRERTDKVAIPVDLLKNLYIQHEMLAGRNNDEVLSLAVNRRSGSVRFNIASGFNYRVILVVLAILLGLIVYAAVKISTRRIKKERDELARSRKRMVRIREAERSHLASELHDGPMQDLLRVISSYVAPLSKVVPDSGHEYLYGMESGLRNVAGGLRSICSDLKPPVLAHFGLEKAMAAYAREFELRNPNLHVDVNVQIGTRQLPMEVRLPLYRIFQEALTNVERHSSATHVSVDLRRRSDRIDLSVDDDGIGFNQPTRLFQLEEEGHFGISGMAQRAQSLGGTLRLESSPGNGTKVHVIVPLPDAELIEI